MNIQEAIAAIESYEAAMQAYGQAMGVMSCDGSTAAPKKSVSGRGRAISYLAGQCYQLTMDPRHQEALDTVLQHQDQVSPEHYRRAYLLKEELRDMTCVPMDEYMAWQQLQTESDAVWHEAKEKDDFGMFAPYLEKVVEYQRRYAKYRDASRPAYDVLLDSYEKGLNTEKLDHFFSTLRTELTPVILAVKDQPKPDTSFLQGTYPDHEQEAFSRRIMQVMGIDPDCCSLAVTEHPFTHGLNKWDVRVTTKYR